MARPRFYCSPDHPYHICSRSNNREFFHAPMDEIWAIKSAYLHYIATGMNVRVHSFVLMNNHFHMIASFPDANLSAAMLYFMRESSRTIGRECGRINHIFGDRVFRSRLDTYNHYCNVYKYVYRNPVEAGLTRDVVDYKYSSLNGILGQDRLLFPVADDTMIFDSGTEQTVSWLNRAIGRSDLIDIRNGLKKATFQLRKNGKKPHPLDTALC